MPPPDDSTSKQLVLPAWVSALIGVGAIAFLVSVTYWVGVQSQTLAAQVGLLEKLTAQVEKLSEAVTEGETAQAVTDSNRWTRFNQDEFERKEFRPLRDAVRSAHPGIP